MAGDRALDTDTSFKNNEADTENAASTQKQFAPLSSEETPDAGPSPASEEIAPLTDTPESSDQALPETTPPVEAGGDMNMMDFSLEDLLETPIEVWTATKTKTTISDAPAIITVVTQEDIRRFGYHSIAEVLHHVLGFYVVDDHMIPNLGIRGVAGGFMGESGSVKVMIDGQSVSFRSTGGNWLGPELVPLTVVERIEIIRGPASALYGADAFLGVVNIITVNGKDLSLGCMQGSGSYNRLSQLGHDLDMAVGTRYRSFEFTMSGRVTSENRSGLELPKSSPLPDIPAYNAGDTKASGMLLSSKVFHGKVTYYIKDRHTISLMGHVSSLDRGGEFSPWSQMSYGLDADGHLHGTTISLYQSMAGLSFSLIPSDKLSLDLRISYYNGNPRKDDQIDIGSNLYYIKRDFGYNTIETSTEGRWQIIDSLTAVIGAEFLHDWEKLPSSLRVAYSSIGDMAAGDILESSSTRQGREDFYNIGAFAQALLSQFRPYLDLTAGFRYDNHNVYGSQFSGRAGAISNPHKMLYLKLLYGSAFKAPSPLLLYGVPYQVGDIIGNPDLKPQKVHTIEGQAILKPVKYLSFSTGLAYNMLFDKADFIQQGINRVAANISSVKSISWESEAVAEYKEWVKGGISFEHQRTTREYQTLESVYHAYLIGNRNVIYPSFILRAELSGKIPKAFLRASVQLMYVGERPSSEMNALENLHMYSLPEYMLLNATLSTVGIEIIDKRETTIAIIGRNLTNKRVADPGFAGIDYPLLPLTLILQLRQEL